MLISFEFDGAFLYMVRVIAGLHLRRFQFSLASLEGGRARDGFCCLEMSFISSYSEYVFQGKVFGLSLSPHLVRVSRTEKFCAVQGDPLDELREIWKINSNWSKTKTERYL